VSQFLTIHNKQKHSHVLQAKHEMYYASILLTVPHFTEGHSHKFVLVCTPEA